VRHHRRIIGLVAVLASCLLAGLGAWNAHGYFDEASFMDVPSGNSETVANACKVGVPLYFGFAVVPNRSVHLTGAELVGVPASFTVDGIYAVNTDDGKYPMLNGDGNYWRQMGYTDAILRPLTDVTLPAGSMGNWWLVAKVVPHATGKQTIQGITVAYASGWRSGSAFYPQEVGSDCSG
jgi:hypothetical protein